MYSRAELSSVFGLSPLFFGVLLVFLGHKFLKITAAVDFLIETAIVNQWAWSKVGKVLKFYVHFAC